MMREQVQAFIEKHRLIKPGQRILLAVSGGLDSMVMLHLLADLGYPLAVAHVNFQLRGTDSDQDEIFVKEQADKLRLPFHATRFDTSKTAQQEGISIQMAARKLRYDWFDDLCEQHGYEAIATAHHANDQAETMLLHLVKETGIRGIRGMQPQFGNRIRPLLFANRAELERYAQNKEVPYRVDASNVSLAYERNYLRLQVIPALEKLNPNLIKSLAESANHLRFAEMLFEERLVHYRRKLLVSRGNDFHIPLRLLRSYPEPPKLLFELIRDRGFAFDQIEQLLELPIEASGQEFTSTTHRLIKNRQMVILTSIRSESASFITIQPGEKRVNLLDATLHFEEIENLETLRFPNDGSVATVDARKLEFPLVVRRWKKGDYLYPLGMTKPNSNKVGKKKLSDLFTDLKLSQADKERVWILCSGKKVVWVVNHRIDDRFKITPSSKHALRIRFAPKN